MAAHGPTTDPRAVRLARMVNECITALGGAPQPVPLGIEPTGAHWPVPFAEDATDLGADLSDHVLERVTKTLKQAQRDLLRRSADPRFGFRVVGVKDLKPQKGWMEGMDRWAVIVRWWGPKPLMWPHPVTLQSAQMPKDEDLPSDYDFMLKYGEWPEKMMKRLATTRNGKHRVRA